MQEWSSGEAFMAGCAKGDISKHMGKTKNLGLRIRGGGKGKKQQSWQSRLRILVGR